MAAYKAEFLAHHYKGRLHPLQHYIFGYADKLARWGSLTPGAYECDSHRAADQPLDQVDRGGGAGAGAAAAGAKELSEEPQWCRGFCGLPPWRSPDGAPGRCADAGRAVAGYVE